jgi:hypothetical protein
MDEVRDAVSPSRVTEVIVVAMGAAVAVAIYRIDRNYRRWAEANSPLATSRARATAIKASYRRRRSGLVEATQVVGDVLGVIEAVRSARAAS